MTTGLTKAEAAERARLLQVESYQISLDLTGGTVAQSHTEIRFGCQQPGADTFADLDAVAVQKITLNGAPVDPAAITAGRVPLTELAPSNSLVVDATVAVGRGGDGLTGYTDPADGSRYLLANCFPTAAPSVFCCFDQPDLRASITLAVTVPAGWTCIANGEPLHQPDDSAAGEWRFTTVPAMRPYELTLCAGEYRCVTSTQGSPRLTVSSRPALADHPGLAAVTGTVAAALRFYEDQLDVPCPSDKLDIVFAPQLGPLAMQVPGVMYVSEPLLARAADGDDHVSVVLAHEAAHLWVGCLTDARWWDDLWLAEALASYLSYRAAQAVLGQPDAWAEFAMTGQASAYQADDLPGTEPVSSPVGTAANALARPPAITYSKGTAVIRQLAALIGDDAMWAGLHDYLTRYAWSAACLTDVIACWSRASGFDLSGWAAQWLQESGTSVLRPEIRVGPDGIITSLAIVQTPPTAGEGAGHTRAHQITVGCYQQNGSRLACCRRISVRADSDWTHVPELTGSMMPEAIILNDTDQTFASVEFDPASWTALVASAMDVSDPVAESVCWQAAWRRVQHGRLEAAEFAAMVARRIVSGGPAAGREQLIELALTGADYYAEAEHRAAARQQLAAAALSAAEQARPGGRDQRLLACGFAACADSPGQLGLLRFWLDGRCLPAGLAVGLELRIAVLGTLAAHDLLSGGDLDAYAAADPVSADVELATLRARRPAIAAKETAWTAALDPEQPPRLALAFARGIWVPGQQDLLSRFRDRYFTQALPAAQRRDPRTARRLARALYPAILPDSATLAATGSALASLGVDDPVRAVLLEQGEMLRRSIRARRRAGQTTAG